MIESLEEVLKNGTTEQKKNACAALLTSSKAHKSE
jgi:hypothetical protein